MVGEQARPRPAPASWQGGRLVPHPARKRRMQRPTPPMQLLFVGRVGGKTKSQAVGSSSRPPPVANKR